MGAKYQQMDYVSSEMIQLLSSCILFLCKWIMQTTVCVQALRAGLRLKGHPVLDMV
jgi:hypothetical protein